MDLDLTVQVTCPHCGQAANVKSSLLGSRVKCPDCGDSFLAAHRNPNVNARPESYWKEQAERDRANRESQDAFLKEIRRSQEERIAEMRTMDKTVYLTQYGLDMVCAAIFMAAGFLGLCIVPIAGAMIPLSLLVVATCVFFYSRFRISSVPRYYRSN